MNEIAIKIIGIVAVLLFAKSVDEFVVKGVFDIRQLWIRIPLFILVADYHYAVVQYPLFLVGILLMTISMCVLPKEIKKMFMEWKEGRTNENH
ncbi:MAG: hypothetical protein IJR70_04795 [Eubacterium sp.]|nr:hypothetical protein [Eubacterium sp.]